MHGEFFLLGSYEDVYDGVVERELGRRDVVAEYLIEGGIRRPCWVF